MPDLFDSQLAAVDWVILAGYFGLIVAIGALASRGTGDTTGFFLGGRRMPAWAVAMSFAATTLSAATFIGYPQAAFAGDLTLLAHEVSKLLAALLVALLLLPALYRAGHVTVYGYLGDKAGPGAATAASAVFLLGRLLASGARLFIAGTAFSLILYGNLDPPNLVAAIVLFGVVGTLYTALGGIKAVIWTDTLQLVVVVGAVLVSIALLLNAIPLSPGEMVEVVRAEKKHVVFDTNPDLSDASTLWAALALTVFYAAAFGTDQDMAQRLLTCKTLRQSVGSLIGAILMSVTITMLFMFAGLLLYFFYSGPAVMGDAAPGYAIVDAREVYPRFLLNELPIGVRGLALAGLFAAAMSSLDSAINAMASSAWADLLKSSGQPADEAHAAAGSRSNRFRRVLVVAMGVALTGVASGMVLLYDPSEDTLVLFALGVMTFAYAGLMGVFLCVVTIGRGSTPSVVAALVTGMSVIVGSRYAEPLSRFELAWPYWMVIATAASFGVCSLGSRRA
ncbi:MAG: sodium:solute symporter family transporter [Phycisphaeraceae bacterium]